MVAEIPPSSRAWNASRLLLITSSGSRNVLRRNHCIDQIVTKKPRSDAPVAVRALEDGGDHLTGADEWNQFRKNIRRHDRYFAKHARGLHRVEDGNAITGSNVKAAERLVALEKRQGSAVSLFF